MKEITFSYIVGSRWSNNPECINSYCYHREVQHGTMSDALNFLDYVKSQHPVANQDEWKIFILKELE